MAAKNSSSSTSAVFPEHTTDGVTPINLVTTDAYGKDATPRAIYFAVDGVYNFEQLDGVNTSVDAVRGLQLAIAPALCLATTASGLKFNALY